MSGKIKWIEGIRQVGEQNRENIIRWYRSENISKSRYSLKGLTQTQKELYLNIVDTFLQGSSDDVKKKVLDYIKIANTSSRISSILLKLIDDKNISLINNEQIYEFIPMFSEFFEDMDKLFNMIGMYSIINNNAFKILSHIRDIYNEENKHEKIIKLFFGIYNGDINLCKNIILYYPYKIQGVSNEAYEIISDIINSEDDFNNIIGYFIDLDNFKFNNDISYDSQFYDEMEYYIIENNRRYFYSYQFRPDFKNKFNIPQEDLLEIDKCLHKNKLRFSALIENLNAFGGMDLPDYYKHLQNTLFKGTPCDFLTSKIPPPPPENRSEEAENYRNKAKYVLQNSENTFEKDPIWNQIIPVIQKIICENRTEYDTITDIKPKMEFIEEKLILNRELHGFFISHMENPLFQKTIRIIDILACKQTMNRIQSTNNSRRNNAKPPSPQPVPPPAPPERKPRLTELNGIIDRIQEASNKTVDDYKDIIDRYIIDRYKKLNEEKEPTEPEKNKYLYNVLFKHSLVDNTSSSTGIFNIIKFSISGNNQELFNAAIELNQEKFRDKNIFLAEELPTVNIITDMLQEKVGRPINRYPKDRIYKFISENEYAKQKLKEACDYDTSLPNDH